MTNMDEKRSLRLKQALRDMGNYGEPAPHHREGNNDTNPIAGTYSPDKELTALQGKAVSLTIDYRER